MKHFFISLLLFLIHIYGVRAQSTLNIHQKNDVVVCIDFADQPVVTYIEGGIHVKSNKIEIDIPYGNIEKFSFVNGLTSIPSIRWDGSDQEVSIYTMNGKLIKSVSSDGNTLINIPDLPEGTYIITQDQKSYKITIRK